METDELGLGPIFRFRLYASEGGEIGTFLTGIPAWEPGELVTIEDGRRFEIRSISLIAGGEIDGLLEVDQVE